MLEELHDPVLSQPICQVGSEPPFLSSEKNFVHGHFCYWYNVAQYCQCHIRAEAAHYSRRKTSRCVSPGAKRGGLGVWRVMPLFLSGDETG